MKQLFMVIVLKLLIVMSCTTSTNTYLSTKLGKLRTVVVNVYNFLNCIFLSLNIHHMQGLAFQRLTKAVAQGPEV